jgi:hypothetical protein
MFINKYCIYSIIIIVIFVSCSSCIPENDHVYNNCIVFRMTSDDWGNDRFSWVNIVNNYGVEYKAFPLSSGEFFDPNGYFVLFNVPPGMYSAESAGRRDDKVVATSSPLADSKVNFGDSITIVWHYGFTDEIKKKLTIEIEENQLKFIGSVVFSNITPPGKRIYSSQVSGNVYNTIDLVSWKSETANENLTFMRKCFKNTFWAKLFLEEF